MRWTDKQTELAVDLWEKGHSATEIAHTLYEHGFIASRNAVIGKMTRMGLQRAEPKRLRGQRRAGHPSPFRGKSRPPRKKSIIERAKLQKVKDTVPVAAVPVGMVPVLELQPHHCRWPTNQTLPNGDLLFCGAPVQDGKPYCAHHAAIATRKVA